MRHLKSVDRHTQGRRLTAAVPGCPSMARGPAETPQPGVAQERGWQGLSWALAEEPGGSPSLRRGHQSVVCRQWKGIGRSVAELGVQVGTASSQAVSPPGALGPQGAGQCDGKSQATIAFWGRCAESRPPATSEVILSPCGRETREGVT